MADERIELKLDLGPSVENAKQLGAALQTTKADATAFAAALESVDVEAIQSFDALTQFDRAVDELWESLGKASSALKETKIDASAFYRELENVGLVEIKVEAETTALQRALEKVKDVQDRSKVTTTAFGDALAKLATEEAKATAELKRLADAESEVAAETARITALFKPAAASLDAVALAANREHAALAATTTVMASAGAGTRNLGQTMLATSYAAQDFTSQLGNRGLAGGLAAVQNNIPGILFGLGVGGGLAGVLSVVSVSAGLVYENWDKIATLWRDEETTKEAARQKDLAKSIDDVREATEKQLATKSKESMAQGGNLGKAIKEFGGDQVRKELEKAYKEQFGNFGDDHTRQAVTDIIGGANKGDAQSNKLIDQMTDSTFIRRDSDVMQRLRGEPTDKELKAKNDADKKKEAAANTAFIKDLDDKKAAAVKGIADVDDNMGKLGDQFKKDQADADAAKAKVVAKGRKEAGKLVTTPEQAARFRAQADRNRMEQAPFDDMINQGAGGRLNDDDVGRGGTRLRNLVKQGADPIIAAQAVIADLIANQEMLNNTQTNRWNQLREKSRNLRSQITRNRK